MVRHALVRRREPGQIDRSGPATEWSVRGARPEVTQGEGSTRNDNPAKPTRPRGRRLAAGVPRSDFGVDGTDGTAPRC